MRELKRSVARHLMDLYGIKQVNRKKYSETRKDGVVVKRSYFAKNWRKFLDPESDLHKSLREIANADKKRRRPQTDEMRAIAEGK